MKPITTQFAAGRNQTAQVKTKISKPNTHPLVK